MTTQIKLGAIDSDAHVVETDHTWDFMDPSEEKYRPQLYGTDGGNRHPEGVARHRRGLCIKTQDHRALG